MAFSLLSGKAGQKLTNAATNSATNAANAIFNDMCPDISRQVDDLRTVDGKHKICQRSLFGGPKFYVNDAGVETVWSAGMGKKKRHSKRPKLHPKRHPKRHSKNKKC